MRTEQLVGIAAEAGGDAVDRLLPGNLCGQKIGSLLHLVELRNIQRDLCTVQRDIEHLRARQRRAIEADILHHRTHAPT